MCQADREHLHDARLVLPRPRWGAGAWADGLYPHREKALKSWELVDRSLTRKAPMRVTPS